MAEKFNDRFGIAVSPKDAKASEGYKGILKECVSNAHKARHGAATPEKKPEISYPEAESFVYLTGIFIRLTISAGFRSTASK